MIKMLQKIIEEGEADIRKLEEEGKGSRGEN